MTTEKYIRIGLGVVVLALVIFKNYDAGMAIGIAMAVYEFITRTKETEITNLKDEMKSFRKSEEETLKPPR